MININELKKGDVFYIADTGQARVSKCVFNGAWISPNGENRHPNDLCIIRDGKTLYVAREWLVLSQGELFLSKSEACAILAERLEYVLDGIRKELKELK
ncbi:hypothetical protein N9137_00965 [Pseudomonadales bacterium]|nr:hypothetical protein [Pseudomonadales bacterium]